MVWTFVREGRRLRYEIRRGAGEVSYEIVVRRMDAEPVLERFANPTDLIERSLVLQQQLIDEGWQPQG